MPKDNVPEIKNVWFGELGYVDTVDGLDPEIFDDALKVSLAVHVSVKVKSEDLTLVVRRLGDDYEQELSFDALNADTKACEKNKDTGRYFHFHLDKLACKANYHYEIHYQGVALDIPPHGTGVSFLTPPARKDPAPLKIAIGGDQERHEQFNPIAACFGFDNQTDTARLYEHMGAQGDKNALASDDIEGQPYQLFIQLGDLFNGEVYVSLRNLFRPGRKFFERHVETLAGYRHHLKGDFGAPVGNHLAHMTSGVNVIADDHDTGQNNAVPPVNDKERAVQARMCDAFHEYLLLPDFLSANKKGPYYSKRIGQSEFFFLHNRYTQEVDKDEAYLLGEEQWAWLEESLQSSQASHKVLVSPLPLVMGKNPNEDYRAHWQEWHRLMQLCRQYKISTLLTADSHNYSLSEIHVRECEDETPWVVHQHLVGTLGGSKQVITDEEMASINKEGRPPLLPNAPEFNAALYEGSTVKAYFSPGKKRALLPQAAGDSQWSADGLWPKGVHAYAGLTFFPSITLKEQEQEVFIEEATPSWLVEGGLFAVDKHNKTVHHEPLLDLTYGD